MGTNLKAGGTKHSGMATTSLLNLKRGISNDQTMLSPSEIDSLRRDLKQTVQTSKSISLRHAA